MRFVFSFFFPRAELSRTVKFKLRELKHLTFVGHGLWRVFPVKIQSDYSSCNVDILPVSLAVFMQSCHLLCKVDIRYSKATFTQTKNAVLGPGLRGLVAVRDLTDVRCLKLSKRKLTFFTIAQITTEDLDEMFRPTNCLELSSVKLLF